MLKLLPKCEQKTLWVHLEEKKKNVIVCVWSVMRQYDTEPKPNSIRFIKKTDLGGGEGGIEAWVTSGGLSHNCSPRGAAVKRDERGCC